MAATTNRQTARTFPDANIAVIDYAGNDLIIMPESQVIRQKLRHRTVLVALRNHQGHIFLYKNPASGHGSDQQGEAWLAAVHGRVLAGEPRYDAALRLLGETLGITGLELFETARFSLPETESMGSLETTLFLTAKTSALPSMRSHDQLDGMFVDKEELQAIIQDYPYMATPPWSLVLPYLLTSPS